MLESEFQANLIKELYEMFDGCIVLHIDVSLIQGFPDLLILYKNKWAVLESKRAKDSRKRPNQDYYVGLLNEMSFASFINPSNKEEVLYELQRSFKT
jgi:hypothetical protein